MEGNAEDDADSKYLKLLLLTLNQKYAGDVGLFNIYFLNYVVLQVTLIKGYPILTLY